MRKFSRNLRKLMVKRGVNQVELAKLSGVKQQYISRYLNEDPHGKTPRDLETLLALCSALDCTLFQLTGLPQLRKTGLPALSSEAIRLAEMYDDLPRDDERRTAILRLLHGE